MPRKLDVMRGCFCAFFVVVFSLIGCAQSVTSTTLIADVYVVDEGSIEASQTPSTDAASVADEQPIEDVYTSDAVTEIAVDAAVAEPRGEAMVRMLPLSTDTYVSGVMSPVQRIHVYSSGRPISVKKISFGIEPILNVHRPDYHARVEEVRIELGSTVLTDTDGAVRHGPASSHACGALDQPCDGGVVTFGSLTSFTFHREIVVDQAGVILTFSARVTTPHIGGYLNVHFFGFARSSYTARQTQGSLSPETMESGRVLFTGAGACESELRWASYGEIDQESLVDALFLWSDRTALNHNDRDCRNGGSRDWFNSAASLPEPMGGYSLLQRVYQR